jgi:hypothetical protein
MRVEAMLSKSHVNLFRHFRLPLLARKWFLEKHLVIFSYCGKPENGIPFWSNKNTSFRVFLKLEICFLKDLKLKWWDSIYINNNMLVKYVKM